MFGTLSGLLTPCGGDADSLVGEPQNFLTNLLWVELPPRKMTEVGAETLFSHSRLSSTRCIRNVSFVLNMTIPVALQDIQEKARPFGRFAFVITSAGASSPRVTHVEVSFAEHDGPVIQTELGRSACRELAGNSQVTVLWPTKSDNDELSLIVDGHVQEIPEDGQGGKVLIIPTSAILHRKRSISS